MDGQLDIFELLKPESPTIDLDALTGFTMAELHPDEFDAIALAWREAYQEKPWNEWRMFPGWDESQTGRNAIGTPHPTFTYTASILCSHWRETTAANRAGYCQCVKGMCYRIYCVGCEWWTPVADDENEAAELMLDHCWPGWRELPVIEGKQSADYPSEWQAPGAPIRECRGLTKYATRHVPGGSPYGGYRTAVIRDCKQHNKEGG